MVWLVNTAHSLGMGVGLKNGAALIPVTTPTSGGKTIGQLVDWCVGGWIGGGVQHEGRQAGKRGTRTSDAWLRANPPTLAASPPPWSIHSHHVCFRPQVHQRGVL